MKPSTLALIMQGLQAAITAAPAVTELVTKAKDFISTLFSKGLISKAQQDALHAHVDSVAAMAKEGIIPPHWQVEADPA